ncbi:glycoside hydrolase, partial [Eremomyces bilateralis CBS 781.70]
GYSDNPYRHSSYLDPRTAEMGGIDPTSIEDDGDDGLQHANPARRSVLSLGRSRQSPATSGLVATGAAGAAAGGVLAASKAHDGSGGQGPETPGEAAEKSEWLSQQQAGKKKQRWIITVVVVLVILAIIAGAVVGGILGSQKANKNKDPASDGGTNGQTAAEDDASGDLSKDSKEIKALLNNPDLHRVFPGMDYTPLNSQYPDCLVNPPSQNNVTRDVAVLSQLSNKLRMYGTDCNQTQLVLHAIDRLALKDMKVWLGVWLDTNQTTNDRQMSQMWDILDEYGDDPFEGLVVGNEILFRKDMTESQLGLFLQNVKSNLTSKGVKLPLATSDLGSSWTTTLATYVDVIMSNIHPFFGGVAIDVAASWTWTFWQENDIPASAGTNKRQIISEVGWPSEGGNDCAPNPKCSSPTAGAVAGIPEMNQFMNDWVCQALKNGTEYYWFEAFDEPWKIRFNTEDQQWEDKWGLMDVNRNLKPGVKIPDCGGQT